MHKLTLLPLVLVVACGSEDRCDPFLEAADCASGQTPISARRHGVPQQQDTPAPSHQLGPTAGPVGGNGPTAGPVGGNGPTAGTAGGNGPTAGSVGGNGPTAGSTNPADYAMATASAADACATFCEAFYGGACAAQLGDLGVSPSQLIGACKTACGCLSQSIPECMAWLAGVFSECADRGDCGVASACLDNLSPMQASDVPASCATITTAIESCGGGDSININL